MMTQLFDKPIFYRPDGSSSWQPVDTHLSPTTDRTSALSANRAPSRIAFDAAGSAAGFLRLRGGGHAINIGLPTALRAARTASLPQSQEDGSYAEYANFLPGGVDLRVFPETDGYSMFLVLSARPSSSSFSFTIDAPGLALGPDPLGTPNGLAFTDAAGNVVGEMPRPYMQDSSYVEGLGSGLYSEAVAMSYTGGNGHWLLTLSIDPAFLDTATYPVYVDPSVYSFPGYGATAQDTFASSKYPGSNFNTYKRPDSPGYREMWLGNEPGTNYYNQVFIQFKDLNTVLGNAVIDSAYLEFYPYWQYYHTGTRQSQVKRVTSAWQANQVTWNARPTVEANAYMSIATTQGQFSHANVTQYVQDVVDGAWVDNGLQINVDSQGQGGWKRIVSLDDSDPSLLPHLDVTWHATHVPIVSSVWPDGELMEDGTFEWTYDDGDGNSSTTGTQAALQVQVNTAPTFAAGSMVSDSGVVSTSSWSWTLPGSVSLTDGQQYYWRVHVSDGSSWSNWYQTSLYWDTTQVGTGISDSDDTVTSPSDLGLTQQQIDYTNAEFEAYMLDPVNIGVEYPDMCPDGCTKGVPSHWSLIDDVQAPQAPFKIFHEKTKVWCVVAAAESILNWMLPSSGWASPTVLQRQQAIHDYDSSTIPFHWKWDPVKGTGTNKGLHYVNLQLAAAGDGRSYVPETVTPSGSLLRFKSYITADVYNRDRPLFARVQLYRSSYKWHTHIEHVAHATLAVGYTSNGSFVDVADPFPSNACVNPPNSGPFDPNPDLGCVWKGFSADAYFHSLDTEESGGANQLWY